MPPYSIDLAKQCGLFIEYDNDRPGVIVVGMYIDGDKVAAIPCDERILRELVEFFDMAPRRLGIR